MGLEGARSGPRAVGGGTSRGRARGSGGGHQEDGSRQARQIQIHFRFLRFLFIMISRCNDFLPFYPMSRGQLKP